MTMMDRVKVRAHNTAVYSFCCEVTLKGFEDQSPIEEPKMNAEIVETAIAKRKYETERYHQIASEKTCWLFGGIEQSLNNKFIVLFAADCADDTLEIVPNTLHPDSVNC